MMICPVAFTPSSDDAPCPHCCCDRVAGHLGTHHCPICDVRWSLESERAA